MTEDVDPRVAPLAFALGVASAFVGYLVGDHDAGALYHLPHQALLAVPLGVGTALAMRSEGKGILAGLAASLAGFLTAAALLALSA